MITALVYLEELQPAKAYVLDLLQHHGKAINQGSLKPVADQVLANVAKALDTTVEALVSEARASQ